MFKSIKKLFSNNIITNEMMKKIKEKRFVDYAKIILKAGNGGNGSTHKTVMRNKITKDGGCGGKGGSIFVRANKDLNKDLSIFKKHKIVGNNGEHGRARDQNGKNGKDIHFAVPTGTEIYLFNEEDESKKYLTFLEKHNEEIRIVKGGNGGIGIGKNRNLKECDLGKEGETKTIFLQLKILCDIGLIGFPNVGKSTLLGSITRALPKIANYPFTTLNPIIGKLNFINGKKLTIGDIPGIIQDAHKNKGLGFEFLLHISRCKLLVFVLDISNKEKNIIEQYKILKNELEKYNSELLLKKSLIIINKIDIMTPKDIESQIKNFKNYFGLNVIEISAKEALNLEQVVSKFYDLVVSN